MSVRKCTSMRIYTSVLIFLFSVGLLAFNGMHLHAVNSDNTIPKSAPLIVDFESRQSKVSLQQKVQAVCAHIKNKLYDIKNQLAHQSVIKPLLKIGVTTLGAFCVTHYVNKGHNTLHGQQKISDKKRGSSVTNTRKMCNKKEGAERKKEEQDNKQRYSQINSNVPDIHTGMIKQDTIDVENNSASGADTDHRSVMNTDSALRNVAVRQQSVLGCAHKKNMSTKHMSVHQPKQLPISLTNFSQTKSAEVVACLASLAFKNNIIKAVKDADVKKVHMLLKSGMNIKDIRTDTGGTLLHVLANQPFSEHMSSVAHMLIDADVDVNVQDNKGKTVLMGGTYWTRYTDHFNLFKLFIKRGADPCIQDICRNTAFVYAIDRSDIRCMRVLSDMAQKKKDTSLCYVANGEWKLNQVIDKLVSWISDFSMRPSEIFTPWIKQYKEVLEVLLKTNTSLVIDADRIIKDETVLMHVVKSGDDQLLDMLFLKASPTMRLEIQDELVGNTALITACHDGNEYAVKQIVAKSQNNTKKEKEHMIQKILVYTKFPRDMAGIIADYYQDNALLHIANTQGLTALKSAVASFKGFSNAIEEQEIKGLAIDSVHLANRDIYARIVDCLMKAGADNDDFKKDVALYAHFSDCIGQAKEQEDDDNAE